MIRLSMKFAARGGLCCAMLFCVPARAVDTVTEPEKCLLRAEPYQFAFQEKEDLLITGNSGGIYAYDAATGEQRWHRYLLSSRGYAGSTFGRRQVLGWSEQGVFLLDAVTGRETWWRRVDQCGQVYHCVLSPEEDRVLAVCERGCVLFGVADRSQRVLPAMSGFCGWFQGAQAMIFMTFERKGGTGGGDDNQVRKWQIMDANTGTVTPCREERYSDDAPWPTFSVLGQFAELMGDGDNKTLKISDARTGAILHEFQGLSGMGRGVSWMKDGKRLFCVALDRKEVRVIDAETGAVQAALSQDGHRFGYGAVFEDAEGTAWVFSRDAANNRYVWKLAPDGAPRKVLDGSRIASFRFYFDRGASGGLVTISTEEDQLWVYGVYSLDGMSRMAEWRCRSAKPNYGGFNVNKALTHVINASPIKRNDYGRPQNMAFALYTQDSENPVRSGRGNVLAISPDGHYLALQTDDQLACLYDAQADRVAGQYAPPGNGEGQRGMMAAFSDDGKRMALNNTESLEVTDLAEDYPRRVMTAPDKRLWWGTLCFSPDGSRLLCGGNNRALLFDASSGALLHSFEETERFADLYQHQYGSFWNSLANAAKDWAGVVTDRFKGGSQLSAIFTEEGRRVITHVSGQILRVWDTDTGKLLHTIHTGLPEKRNARGEIRNSIVLSANGRFAFTSNGDNYSPAGLWSLADGTLLRKYALPQSNWLSCVPQDDGKALFVISNGDLYRWPGAPQELLDQLPIMDKPSPN